MEMHTMNHLVKNLFVNRAPKAPKSSTPRRVRPGVEGLEDRMALSTVPVTAGVFPTTLSSLAGFGNVPQASQPADTIQIDFGTAVTDNVQAVDQLPTLQADPAAQAINDAALAPASPVVEGLQPTPQLANDLNADLANSTEAQVVLNARVWSMAVNFWAQANALGGMAVGFDNGGGNISYGQCTDLVNACLQAAGAQTLRIDPTVHYPGGDPQGKYIWGQEVARANPAAPSLNGIMAGDVLQFEGVHFEGTDPVTGGFYTQDFQHHTAIVSSVNGQQIGLIEQNVNGSGVVSGTINLADMTSGEIIAYHPEAV
jgi:hypothetical protein